MSVSAVSFVRRAVARLVFVAALVLVATLGAVLLARLAPGGAAVELYGTGATRAEYDGRLTTCACRGPATSCGSGS
jgi:hypothetical protein